MVNKQIKTMLALIIMVLALSSCSSSVSPSQIVEDYINAMVAKDDVATVNLSCSDWESNAKADGAGFEGVDVALEGLACSVISESDVAAVVSCTGKFIFQYAGGEDEEIGLDRRNYSMVNQAGDWKMCGYE